MNRRQIKKKGQPPGKPGFTRTAISHDRHAAKACPIITHGGSLLPQHDIKPETRQNEKSPACARLF
jgi:hypothetical protein